MSVLRTNPYWIKSDLRIHRPTLERAMRDLPADITVTVVTDGSDTDHSRLFRCVIDRGDERLADVRKVRDYEDAWALAVAEYEGKVAA